MIAPTVDRMIRPRGVLVRPHGTSMMTRVNETHLAEVLRVRRMLEQEREAEVNAAAPVTVGTRSWL
jgi:hypothetical protein